MSVTFFGRWLRLCLLLFPVMALATITVMSPEIVVAQDDDDDDDDDDNANDDDDDNANDDDDDDDDDDDNPFGGIEINAKGVFGHRLQGDLNGRLDDVRRQAAKAKLGDIAASAKLRKVSLPRLERAVAARLAAGKKPTDEMLRLAGLTKIQYVFCYPKTGDIVIAGPAEGWARDNRGVHRGIVSGRPTLNLEDLIVVLRAYGPSGEDVQVISCSIDPTEAGLVKMQQFLRKVGGRATPADTKTVVDGLRASLGLQEITIRGISPKTHFAKVMVEADYRMKLIGIGAERPPIRMGVYVDRVNPADVARNAMQRWWFTPDYKAVRESKDKLAMKLEGDSVKLVGEQELVDEKGERRGTGKQSRASQIFTLDFTKNYPQIAKRATVYAELRNVIDLAVAAAYIQHRGWFDKADWDMKTFGSEKQIAVEQQRAPRQVPTAVNAIWRGRTLMTPVGGGVRIEPTAALSPENMQADTDGSVESAHKAVYTEKVKEDQWWWD
jgi:hypothetical protein